MVEGRTLVMAVSLAKTLGYSAPEKDTGRHSPKSNVYSYGVVSCCSLWSVSGNVLSQFICMFPQIVLETLSRQLPYSLKRDDPILV